MTQKLQIHLRDGNQLADPLVLARGEFNKAIPKEHEAGVQTLLEQAQAARIATGGAYLSTDLNRKLQVDRLSSTSPETRIEAAMAQEILQRADVLAAAQGIGLEKVNGLEINDLRRFRDTSRDSYRVLAQAVEGIPRSTTEVTIQRGDALSKIASADNEYTRNLRQIARKAMGAEADKGDVLGTLVSALAEKNNLADPNLIKVGQTLKLPSEADLKAHIQELRVAGKIDAQGNFAQNGHRPEPTVVAQATPATRPSPSRGDRAH